MIKYTCSCVTIQLWIVWGSFQVILADSVALEAENIYFLALYRKLTNFAVEHGQNLSLEYGFPFSKPVTLFHNLYKDFDFL